MTVADVIARDRAFNNPQHVITMDCAFNNPEAIFNSPQDGT